MSWIRAAGWRFVVAALARAVRLLAAGRGGHGIYRDGIFCLVLLLAGAAWSFLGDHGRSDGHGLEEVHIGHGRADGSLGRLLLDKVGDC